MDEKQRQDVLSIFKGMSEPANEGTTVQRGKKASKYQMGSTTIVVCGKKKIRKILAAALRPRNKML